MQIPEWQVQMVRRIARELADNPEKYTGSLVVDSNAGTISTVKLTVTYRPNGGVKDNT